MATGKEAVRHAGGLYGKTYRRVLRPVRGVEHEAHHLHEVEQAGESGETPYIAILGLLLFLGSIFLVMLCIALAAYAIAS